MKSYTKPVTIAMEDLSEGIYMASGAASYWITDGSANSSTWSIFFLHVPASDATELHFSLPLSGTVKRAVLYKSGSDCFINGSTLEITIYDNFSSDDNCYRIEMRGSNFPKIIH